MRKGILYLFAAAALALIISVAWWTREYVARHYESQVHTVQAGETAEGIANDYGVTLDELASANDAQPEAMSVTPGEPIVVPIPSPTPVNEWLTHLIGLGGTVLGVLMSLWLALVAGLLPKRIRGQVLGISLVLGVASYASTYAVVQGPVLLTPTFLFIAIRDGFAWAAAFPMLARALGIRDTPPPEPEPVPATPPPAPVVEALPPPEDDAPAG